ncbi:MotA/TolQ/ExbB proton channel family protein [candidate division KSB1 bacterium]|nr:MAG: MotA/TolQ/ExbB proton channel family protein [candidate division KSB1 bacterium]MBC6950718.1 MotA/TolQ/ExbB proton channel family protein [candidate division KSB1 bacterium]MCE7945026.1 MotA/TolQ/ExbB proton channel family protein [Chlorobi bacterium CHB1]MDL1874654.1 MotA/TolQ/ExbB proton channel family protein [Cytophagia bacterium CHB2]
MKRNIFLLIVIAIELAVATYIYYGIFGAPNDRYGLEFIYKGGPLVILLMLLIMLDITFIVERGLSLNKAQGRGTVVNFLHKVQRSLMDGDVDTALNACNEQRGSMANIIRAGLERYQRVNQKPESDMDKVAKETQRAIDIATKLEIPLLEKNLLALATIASIATMVGLLGTTIGMIRAFRALAHAGAPDAVQLSIGISEALINTAGGLVGAIIGIVFYNYFVNKVDRFTYMIDEASYSVVEILTGKPQESR